MVKVKCTISYDGTHFNGYQIQPVGRTVQGELEHVLHRMHKQTAIRVTASGRTDAGVHAKGQVVHFTSPLNMSDANWKKALNTLLPPDVRVHEAKVVSECFHARFDAVAKEYRYYIHHTQEPDVFKRHYTHHHPWRLNIGQMQNACRHLEGTHDFTTFSSAKASARGSKVRTLYNVSCEQAGSDVILVFYGNGFLYKMVRILTGVLLDVGSGLIDPDDIPMLFEELDRRKVGKTAPPEGLYLWQVFYGE